MNTIKKKLVLKKTTMHLLHEINPAGLQNGAARTRDVFCYVTTGVQ
ncbi:MAG: hypothetical protein JNM68_09210 [Dinghuibacter sp.]|nr:hypothetical protein [Dinghuibacter sp.]